jgi:hypothetical protein
MSTKSRQSIYDASIMGAKIHAQSAREAAKKPRARRIAPKPKSGRSMEGNPARLLRHHASRPGHLEHKIANASK